MDNIETDFAQKHFLTPEEAGKYAAGTSRVTIDRWIRVGREGRPPLPALKVGRKVMIELHVLQDWLKNGPTVVYKGRGRPRKHQKNNGSGAVQFGSAASWYGREIK